MSCIFCQIAAGEVSCEKVYEDGSVIAFKDLNPVAPIHILVIPKDHIESTNYIGHSNSGIVSKIFEVIAQLSRDGTLGNGEYRVVTNCGGSAGQSVKHLHFHVIAGRNMEWPPG